MYFDKKRIALDKSEYRIKDFSRIKKKNIDKKGVYIIIDDMYASGGTILDVAKLLKEWGAFRVEGWTTHAVTCQSQYEDANNRQCLDDLVCGDTVLRRNGLNVTYIPVSAALLAAEIYKAHNRLATSRAY